MMINGVKRRGQTGPISHAEKAIMIELKDKGQTNKQIAETLGRNPLVIGRHLKKLEKQAEDQIETLDKPIENTKPDDPLTASCKALLGQVSTWQLFQFVEQETDKQDLIDWILRRFPVDQRSVLLLRLAKHIARQGAKD